jgi:hypothetical protein
MPDERRDRDRPPEWAHRPRRSRRPHSRSFFSFGRVGSSTATSGADGEALHDLHLVDAREASLDLLELELLLPGVLRIELFGRRVLLARGEDGGQEAPLVGLLRRLGLLDVDDLGSRPS